MPKHLPLVLASFAFAACGVGTLDSGENDPVGDNDPNETGPDTEDKDDIVSAADAAPEPQDYALLVSPALGEINLGDQLSFVATVSSDNFAGPVTLDLSGALPGWEITYSPSQTLTLLEDESAEILVTVTVPTNGEAGAGALAFALDGELGSRTGDATLTVNNQVVVGIVAGAGEGGHGIGQSILIRQGTDLVIMNNDSIAHRIHADPHQGDDMGPGGSYVLNYDRGGNETAYCHEHGENTGILQIGVE